MTVLTPEKLQGPSAMVLGPSLPGSRWRGLGEAPGGQSRAVLARGQASPHPDLHEMGLGQHGAPQGHRTPASLSGDDPGSRMSSRSRPAQRGFLWAPGLHLPAARAQPGLLPGQPCSSLLPMACGGGLTGPQTPKDQQPQANECRATVSSCAPRLATRSKAEAAPPPGNRGHVANQPAWRVSAAFTRHRGSLLPRGSGLSSTRE